MRTRERSRPHAISALLLIASLLCGCRDDASLTPTPPQGSASSPASAASPSLERRVLLWFKDNRDESGDELSATLTIPDLWFSATWPPDEATRYQRRYHAQTERRRAALGAQIQAADAAGYTQARFELLTGAEALRGPLSPLLGPRPDLIMGRLSLHHPKKQDRPGIPVGFFIEHERTAYLLGLSPMLLLQEAEDAPIGVVAQLDLEASPRSWPAPTRLTTHSLGGRVLAFAAQGLWWSDGERVHHWRHGQAPSTLDRKNVSALSAGRSRLAVVDDQQKILLLNPETGAVERQLALHDDARPIALVVTQKNEVVALSSGYLHRFSASGEPLGRVSVSEEARSLLPSPDGRDVLVQGPQGATVYDLERGRPRFMLPPAARPVDAASAYDATGDRLAISVQTAQNFFYVLVFDTQTFEVKNTIALSRPARALDFSPDGRSLAAVTAENLQPDLTWWRLDDPQPSAPVVTLALDRSDEQRWRIQHALNDASITLARGDGHAERWQAPHLSTSAEEMPSCQMRERVLSPDRRALAFTCVGSGDPGETTIVDLTSGRFKGKFPLRHPFTHRHVSFKFSPDGDLWRVDDSTAQRWSPPHDAAAPLRVNALIRPDFLFSADEKNVAWGVDRVGQLIKIDATSLQQERAHTIHSDDVTRAVFFPEHPPSIAHVYASSSRGDIFAATATFQVGRDHYVSEVRAWERESGRRIFHQRFDGAALHLSFEDDDRRLTTFIRPQTRAESPHASLDGWRLSDGVRLEGRRVQSPVFLVGQNVAAQPHGPRWAIISDQGEVTILSSETKEKIKIKTAPFPSALGLSPDGRYLYIDEQDRLRVVEIATQRQKCRIDVSRQSRTDFWVPARSGPILSIREPPAMLDPEDCSLTELTGFAAPVIDRYAFTLTPDKTVIASQSRAGLSAYDLDAMRPRGHQRDDFYALSPINPLSGGRLLTDCADDATTPKSCVRDADTLAVLETWRGFYSDEFLARLDDGDALVYSTHSGPKSYRVIDPETGDVKHTLRGEGLSRSADTKWVALKQPAGKTTLRPAAVHVYRIKNLQTPQTTVQAKEGERLLAHHLSLDGERLLIFSETRSGEKTIAFHDVHSGARLQKLSLPASVDDIFPLFDGRWLTLGVYARIWADPLQ